MVAVASKPLEFLSWTIPDFLVWDVIRVLAATSTAMLAMFYMRIAFGHHRPEAPEEAKTIRIGIVGYLWLMLPTMLTELASIGDRILPWRLPMYVLFNVYGWAYVRRRL